MSRFEDIITPSRGLSSLGGHPDEALAPAATQAGSTRTDTCSSESASATISRPSPVEDTSLQFTFFAVGDFGSPYSRLGELMNGYCEENNVRPSVILSLGDNFYPRGVSSTSDKQWESSFKDVFLKYDNLRVPWKSVLGNHDYRGNFQAQIDYSTHASNPFTAASEIERCWQLPDRNYNFSLGPVDFFALDTNGVQHSVKAYQPTIEEELRRGITDLNSALAASNATWKIVFGHHPMYSRGLHHGVLGQCLRNPVYSSPRSGEARGYNLEPVLVEHGVAAYFSGHEHAFQHQNRYGVHSFVCGASVEYKFYRGESTEDIDWVDRSRAMGFLAIEVYSSRLIVRFIGGHEDVYNQNTHGVTSGVAAADHSSRIYDSDSTSDSLCDSCAPMAPDDSFPLHPRVVHEVVIEKHSSA